MKTIAFFNNKGGVGKTTLVYHVTWMFSELGVKVVAADLDPQSNLTSAFLDDERIDELLDAKGGARTILGAIQPVVDKLGDIKNPHVEMVDGIGLVPGDLGLSVFEDRLAEAWPACLDDNAANAGDAFRVMSAFRRTMWKAAKQVDADLVLIDVGPSLGAINRAALVAADYVVVPLGADVYSLRGLKNLGPTLRRWRGGWKKRRDAGKELKIGQLPEGSMTPVGYVVLQHAVRQDRPVKAYQRWVDRIPETYATAVLDKQADQIDETDMLASLKHYRSLMPLAQDAKKPMFNLKPADGAIGGHVSAVQACRADFEQLTRRIAERCEITID